jgi:hypothetical protein
MRTKDKEAVAPTGWLLTHFTGHLKMRCSIVWVALALLSVSAIAGCQTGTVWDPLVANALHINSSPLPSRYYYADAAMAPIPPSAFADSRSSGMTDGNDTSRKQ